MSEETSNQNPSKDETQPPKKVDPYSPEALCAYLDQWEHRHLAKGDAKKHNQEFGIVEAHLRKIGERCARRLTAATASLCASCGKPIENGRVYTTVPMYEPQLAQFVNKYACSAKCGEKISDEARARSNQLAQEAQQR